MFASSLLLSLALMPDAEAADIPKIKNVRVRQLDNNGNVSYSLTALTPDADATVASVAGELDGEPVSLTESDAWVHGTAAFSAEPADGAELTLAVYGTDSAVLDTFSGTYTDGVLTLTSTTRDGGGDCTARVGCEEGTSSTTDVDLEVLSALVYGDGTVGLDLAGADALSVASASLSSVETSTSEECVTYSRTGECVEYGTTTTRDDAELDLDELGIVWESDAVEVDGVAELELKAYDADGKKLDKAKVKLAAPWEDDGYGVNVLPLDEDPLTTVAVYRHCIPGYKGADCRQSATAMAVVSDGWTLGDALPEVAEIEIEDGETWSVPVNSYLPLPHPDPRVAA